VINGFVAVPIYGGYDGRSQPPRSDGAAHRFHERAGSAKLVTGTTQRCSMPMNADLTHIRQQNDKLMKLLKAKLETANAGAC
jgi:hypothetical protein